MRRAPQVELKPIMRKEATKRKNLRFDEAKINSTYNTLYNYSSNIFRYLLYRSFFTVALTPELRKKMGEAARRIGALIRYCNAGMNNTRCSFMHTHTRTHAHTR